MMARSNWIIYLLLIGVAGLMIYNRATGDNRVFEKYFNEEYSGTVMEKWIDYKNHASRVLKIEGKNIIVPPGSWTLYDSIIIGDSIRKEKETLEGYIFSKDSIFIIDYRKSIPGMF